MPLFTSFKANFNSFKEKVKKKTEFNEVVCTSFVIASEFDQNTAKNDFVGLPIGENLKKHEPIRPKRRELPKLNLPPSFESSKSEIRPIVPKTNELPPPKYEPIEKSAQKVDAEKLDKKRKLHEEHLRKKAEEKRITDEKAKKLSAKKDEEKRQKIKAQHKYNVEKLAKTQEMERKKAEERRRQAEASKQIKNAKIAVKNRERQENTKKVEVKPPAVEAEPKKVTFEQVTIRKPVEMPKPMPRTISSEIPDVQVEQKVIDAPSYSVEQNVEYDGNFKIHVVNHTKSDEFYSEISDDEEEAVIKPRLTKYSSQAASIFFGDDLEDNSKEQGVFLRGRNEEKGEDSDASA